MSVDIPFNRWNHLRVADVVALFKDAPFAWCIAGGYAVELFLGKQIRQHDDIDVMIYRDEQLRVQEWLAGWQLYAADPPGTLRNWNQHEYLPYSIHDIWGHQIGSDAWQMQLMIAEVAGDAWFSRRNDQIGGKRNELIVHYQGVACIRIEVQLFYKAKNLRPKDEQDFQACLPKLDTAAKVWLKENLQIAYSAAHPWLEKL